MAGRDDHRPRTAAARRPCRGDTPRLPARREARPAGRLEDASGHEGVEVDRDRSRDRRDTHPPPPARSRTRRRVGGALRRVPRAEPRRGPGTRPHPRGRRRPATRPAHRRHVGDARRRPGGRSSRRSDRPVAGANVPRRPHPHRHPATRGRTTGAHRTGRRRRGRPRAGRDIGRRLGVPARRCRERSRASPLSSTRDGVARRASTPGAV